MVKPGWLPDGIAPQNVTRDPRALHMEVLDPRSADVWLHQDPVTAAQFAAFRPEPPLVKSGLAHAAMDFACFLRSPGAAADGPLETRRIGGLEFSRVARPRALRGLAPGDGPTRILVEKHHRIGFEVGTLVRLARLPDGAWYVQQTVSATPLRIQPPSDWEMHVLAPTAQWTICLPPPATVWFFRNLTSFLGPLSAAELPSQPRRCDPPEPL
jgi:hypothetical protein